MHLFILYIYVCNGSDVMKSCGAIPLLNSQVTLDDEFRHQKVSSFLLLRQNKKKLVVCENLCFFVNFSSTSSSDNICHHLSCKKVNATYTSEPNHQLTSCLPEQQQRSVLVLYNDMEYTPLHVRIQAELGHSLAPLLPIGLPPC